MLLTQREIEFSNIYLEQSHFNSTLEFKRDLNLSVVGYKGRSLFNESTLYYGVETNLGFTDRLTFKSDYKSDSESSSSHFEPIKFKQPKIKYDLGYLIEVSDDQVLGFGFSHTDYLAGKFTDSNPNIFSSDKDISSRFVNTISASMGFKNFLNPELGASITKNNQLLSSHLMDNTLSQELLTISVSIKTEIITPQFNLLSRLSHSRITNQNPHINNESLMLGMDYSF